MPYRETTRYGITDVRPATDGENRMWERKLRSLDTTDHPGGFSGVVREAVAEWLARHTGAVDPDEAAQALTVLTRFVGTHTASRTTAG